MSKFYAVLPSNSSMGLYPDNKVSSYRVVLPDVMTLNPDEWEVALSEIQYPNFINNIREGRNKLLFTTNDFEFTVTITPGYYASVPTLISQIEKQLLTQNRPNPIDCKFTYNRHYKHILISATRDVKIFFKSTDIGRMLGFINNVELKKPLNYPMDIVKSDVIASVNNGNFSMFVYSDVVKHNYVGDVKAPLLRAVPIRGNHGEVVCEMYDRPHYLPLAKGSFQTIEVHIRDDTGEPISFATGKAIVTLVFRRKPLLP